MKLFKRITSMLLVAAMALSLLTACGSITDWLDEPTGAEESAVSSTASRELADLEKELAENKAKLAELEAQLAEAKSKNDTDKIAELTAEIEAINDAIKVLEEDIKQWNKVSEDNQNHLAQAGTEAAAALANEGKVRLTDYRDKMAAAGGKFYCEGTFGSQYDFIAAYDPEWGAYVYNKSRYIVYAGSTWMAGSYNVAGQWSSFGNPLKFISEFYKCYSAIAPVGSMVSNFTIIKSEMVGSNPTATATFTDKGSSSHTVVYTFSPSSFEPIEIRDTVNGVTHTISITDLDVYTNQMLPFVSGSNTLETIFNFLYGQFKPQSRVPFYGFNSL